MHGIPVISFCYICQLNETLHFNFHSDSRTMSNLVYEQGEKINGPDPVAEPVLTQDPEDSGEVFQSQTGEANFRTLHW